MPDLVTTRFRAALDALFQLEGFDAVTDDPTDRGGLTKWGISQRAYPNVDIRNLTRESAADLYWKDYWLPLKCDRMASADVASELFELGVNCGIGTASRIFQEAINGAGKAISADGRIGEATLAAGNSIRPERLLLSLRLTAAAHYGQIVGQDASQKRFLKGWLRRLQEREG